MSPFFCRVSGSWVGGCHQKAAADATRKAQWHHQTHGKANRQHPGEGHPTQELLSVSPITLSALLFKNTFLHQVPMARASILWLIGEYCEHVPKIAPDVLRKMAKSFTTEEDIVKLQIINLAAKLYLTNSKQVIEFTLTENQRLWYGD